VLRQQFNSRVYDINKSLGGWQVHIGKIKSLTLEVFLERCAPGDASSERVSKSIVLLYQSHS
jgi:hypothetical protein